MPTGDDRPDDTGSSLLDLGESFLNTLADDDAGSEWREEVEQTLGGSGDVDYDRLATAGIAAGEQIARLREQARASPAAVEDPRAEQTPPIETRDVYDTNGEYAGTRLYVSAEDADAYLSADGSEAVVRTGGTGKTIALPQPATGIVTDDAPLGGMVLFVAYPGGSVLADADAMEGVEQVDAAEDTDDTEGTTHDDLSESEMKWVDESALDDTEAGDE